MCVAPLSVGNPRTWMNVEPTLTVSNQMWKMTGGDMDEKEILLNSGSDISPSSQCWVSWVGFHLNRLHYIIMGLKTPQFCPGNPGSDTNIKIVIGRIGWFGLCGLHCLVEFVSLPECFVAMYAVRSAPRGPGHPANTKRANASCCVGTAAVSAIRGTSTQSHRT